MLKLRAVSIQVTLLAEHATHQQSHVRFQVLVSRAINVAWSAVLFEVREHDVNLHV